ncbi:MAG: cytochrome c family protein [Parvibaculaceae bacterium]|nr:cytochrome c family protein [Parvibaculaceae bacterium]
MKSLLKASASLCLLLGLSLMPGIVPLAHADDWSGGDAVKGEKVFKKCAACHTVTEGGPNMIGPHLSGVLGRKAGTVSDYQYSSAMRAKGAAGLVWGGQTLFDYLKSPRAYVPGTMMSFAGLARDDDRRNLIAYLAQANKITGTVPAGEPAK